MRKIVLIAFVCLCVVSLAACNNKKSKEEINSKIENAKDSIREAMDGVSDKIDEGAEHLKDAWEDAKDDITDGAKEVKKR